MKDKRILITGGGGYLGQFVIDHYYENNEIVVFSRDELKHWRIRKRWPNVQCVLGDVRDLGSLRKAAKGCAIGIFCASLKHLNQINENVDEAVFINIHGARNSRIVADELGFDAACYVSTDKSRLPVSIYGATKYIGGESFIWGSDQDGRIYPRLSTLVCGNIVNSTGSIVPTIWWAIQLKQPLNLYSDTMTRFIITGEEVAGLFDHILTWNGYNVMPKMQSFRVQDLFDVYQRRFGLQYSVHAPDRWVERTHEILISDEEAYRSMDCKQFYCCHYNRPSDRPLPTGISSATNPMSFKELDSFLAKHNYYKPE